MDFVFLSAFNHYRSRSAIISYDIACQWSKRFWQRMHKLPHQLQIDPVSTELNVLIPKFHFTAHRTGDEASDVNHAPYSFNWKPGVGREDGEGVERCWADADGAASSTKEMNPGARTDALTGHFDHSNWLKMVGFSKLWLHHGLGARSMFNRSKFTCVTLSGYGTGRQAHTCFG